MTSTANAAAAAEWKDFGRVFDRVPYLVALLFVVENNDLK